MIYNSSKQISKPHVSVYYNPRTDTWIARHVVRTLNALTLNIFRDNIYGYGKTATAAVQEVLGRISKTEEYKVTVRHPNGHFERSCARTN